MQKISEKVLAQDIPIKIKAGLKFALESEIERKIFGKDRGYGK